MKNFDGSYVEIVSERLKTILQHAALNVPFYRNIDIPKDLIEADPFAALSAFLIVDKSMLMKNQQAFCVECLPQYAYENSTGGSTGQPLEGISSMLYKIKVLDAFRISADDAKKYVQAYETYKPDILECYVDAAYTLALHIKQTELLVKHRPKGVIVSAGTLYPEFEKTIKEVFQAPVMNRYGSREAGDIACTCPAGNIHVNLYTHYVEIMDDEGNPVEEGTGHVVLTLLTNFTMPLIRYKIGDMATIKKHDAPCPCGRDWQILVSIDGRSGSVFRKRDGSIISPLFFVHFLAWKSDSLMTSPHSRQASMYMPFQRSRRICNDRKSRNYYWVRCLPNRVKSRSLLSS